MFSSSNQSCGLQRGYHEPHRPILLSVLQGNGPAGPQTLSEATLPSGVRGPLSSRPRMGSEVRQDQRFPWRKWTHPPLEDSNLLLSFSFQKIVFHELFFFDGDVYFLFLSFGFIFWLFLVKVKIGTNEIKFLCGWLCFIVVKYTNIKFSILTIFKCTVQGH